MRLSGKSTAVKSTHTACAIGIVIGTVAGALGVFIVTNLPKDTEYGGLVLVFGRVFEISDDELLVDEAGSGTGQEPQIVRVKLDEGIFFNCGGSGAETCSSPFDEGEVILGTPVCAYANLINGELHAGKVFLHSECIVSRLPPG
jgi:hypothetical protein